MTPAPDPAAVCGAAQSPEVSPGEITGVLNRALAGDKTSREHLDQLLIDELLRLARSQLARRGGASLH